MRWATLALLILVAACGDDDDAPPGEDAGVDASLDAATDADVPLPEAETCAIDAPDVGDGRPVAHGRHLEDALGRVVLLGA